MELGNTALHATGFVGPDITYHIHQWLSQNGQTGGIDVVQLAYNNILRRNGHLFAGKLSAIPVPGPLSGGSDLAPYAGAEIQVGEHRYQFDGMRWGASLSYVRPKLFVQAAWLGSNKEWSGAANYSQDTDKTLQWLVAYADANAPLEAGLFGSTGSFPLAEGGVDRYHTIAPYVQRDPGPHGIPGIFALYQWGYDANPGLLAPAAGGSMPTLRHPLFDSGMSPVSPTSAHSRAMTIEIFESLLHERALLGLRDEVTDDGLGTLTRSGNVDLDVIPFAKYDNVHLYLESGFMQGGGPVWRAMLWWAVPLGR
ncbi:hypothetical protein EPN52_14005 [bacterium]|nr:MAG: hypothetical protein EPN52_14005 [bacterium]